MVLQGTAYGAANNLAMASRPGQRFWETAWGLIEEHSQKASLIDNVLVLSGPKLLSDALQPYPTLEHISGRRNGDNVVNGDTSRVWPAGTFMCPCFLNDECQGDMTKLHAMYEVHENVTADFMGGIRQVSTSRHFHVADFNQSLIYGLYPTCQGPIS